MSMVDPSYFSKPVVAALTQVSGGRCYWPEPECPVPVTVDIDGDMVLNVEIAHIRGAHKNGPRYVPEMTDEERRRFGNLIFMCPSHHRVIDVLRVKEFSIEKLQDWKEQGEGQSYGVLKLLPGIDEDQLQAALTKALAEHAKELKEQVDKLDSAIARLAAIDQDAASLLRGRMQTANKMIDAGRKLSIAADQLRYMQDTSLFLLTAAQLLETNAAWHDTTDRLVNAAQMLSNTTASQDAAVSILSACDMMSTIDRRLESRIRELRNLEGGY
jgi:hypothetical protein